MSSPVKPIINSMPYQISGWNSDLQTFYRSPSGEIQCSLENFIQDFSREQQGAWRDEIRLLKREAGELMHAKEQSAGYGTILEYRLPYDARRPDVLVLAEGVVVVLELKGKSQATQADLDQTAAYARDLRAYHKHCHGRPVYPVLVPTRSQGLREKREGVYVVAPDLLDQVVSEFATGSLESGPSLDEFLDPTSYCPLPSLVEAARELFESRTLREIWQAKASTEPAVKAIQEIAHEAARTQTRHLVLVSGLPGAGKTLVGMRAVHAKYLDDLSIDRGNGKPTVPGLYLTGNGPLAEVLQYEMKRAGGGGQTFVRHIKSYLDRYTKRQDIIPMEHLIVFDEAQRAFSADKVADTHKDWPMSIIASEAELFVRICDRMPQWSVLVGLIGGGQEIHIGEEEGISQWRDAIEKSPNEWIVHAPMELQKRFGSTTREYRSIETLNLNTEIRFHGVNIIHEFTDKLIDNSNPRDVALLLDRLKRPGGDAVVGAKFYITRDLNKAKSYLNDRYVDHEKARYGILASSRDKMLVRFGVDNSFQGTKQVKVGPWFTEGGANEHSCRNLVRCVTEFQCQGLELDMALVAWGSDFIRTNGTWSNQFASNYAPRGRARVVDPYGIRRNAYRVLLTRGRDGCIIFVPNEEVMNETWDFFLSCGIGEL